MKLRTALLVVVGLLPAAPAPAQTQAQAPAGNLWGVSGQNSIVCGDGTTWVTVTGNMKQVSVAADGTVVAIDPGTAPGGGSIFSWTGSGWKPMPGQLTQISAGSAKNVWGVNGSNSVFRWDGTAWTQVPGNMKQVSVAADGSTWAIDLSTDPNGGSVFFWNGQAWQQIPGQLAQISAGAANNVWGINAGNTIYRWDGTSWTNMPGIMKQVAVASDGTVWALDPAGSVFYWSGTAWQPVPGQQFVSLSAALAGRMEDDNAALKYQGAWTRKTDAAASGGAYTQSSVAGNTVTYTFSGDSVTIFRYLAPNGGLAAATVDGKAWGNLSFYFQEPRYQVPAAIDHLGAGSHTLVLTVGANPPNGSNGTNVTIDAVSAPAPFMPSADQSAALTRVNYYRNLAGLPPADLSLALDLAAQAHGDYNATTGVLDHGETPGTAGFVGANLSDRTKYFGYDVGGSEIIFQGTETIDSVDGWMATVYHRTPIMAYGLTDMGFGISRINGNTMSGIDFGSKRGTRPAARVTTLYPIDGQVDVPNGWNGLEGPDPLPGKSKPVGYPISLQFQQPASVQAAANTGTNLGELFDANGQAVPVYYLDRKTDTNQGFLNGDTFFVIPQQPLNVGATYRAHIKGNDSAGVPFDVSWSFTTVQATSIVNPMAFSVNANDAWIQWATAGAVSSTWIEYGTTIAYGSRAEVNNPGGGPNAVVAHPTGLTPNTTYHFRAVSQDATGRTGVSGDVTFVTPAATQPN